MRTVTGLLVIVGVAIAGCGGDEQYANNPRPPVPINITAAITDGKVSISPKQIGAGPVVIIVANETDKAHRVTVETDVLGSDEGGIRQQTAPINPQGTGRLKIDMRSGDYKISADGDDISDARLEVGKDRASSRDLVQQP